MDVVVAGLPVATGLFQELVKSTSVKSKDVVRHAMNSIYPSLGAVFGSMLIVA